MKIHNLRRRTIISLMKNSLKESPMTSLRPSAAIAGIYRFEKKKPGAAAALPEQRFGRFSLPGR